MEKTRGVVIIAAGVYTYGQWAVNLAMGLRQTDPTTNITLLWKGKALELVQHSISVFNQLIEIPDDVTSRNGIESLLRTKVCLYDLSPYDETIYIDADVVWFPYKPVSQLFEQLKDVDMTIGNRGKTNLASDPRLIWSKSEEMLEKFGDIDIWNLSSEFMYFRKTDAIREFFDVAREYFDEPGVGYTRFAGTVPDELAFQLAIIKTGMAPHKELFLPFYWESYEKKNMGTGDLFKGDWYGYSIGGAQLTVQQKAVYDALVKSYAAGFGIKYPGLAVSKRDIMVNRREI